MGMLDKTELSKMTLPPIDKKRVFKVENLCFLALDDRIPRLVSPWIQPNQNSQKFKGKIIPTTT